MKSTVMENNNVEIKEKKPLGPRFKRFFKDFKNQWELQSMIIPGLIFMIIFSYIPMYGLLIAFKQYTALDTFSTAPWVGLKNFQIIMTDKFFWEAMVNTVAISLMKLAIGFIAPIILAIMIYELHDGPIKRFMQTISYLPHFLSWIVLGGMLITWFSTTGLLNQTLMAVGLMDNPQNYLLDAGKYWWIATLSDIWKEVGWGTILYLAVMSKIDPTYYEAAKTHGCRIREIPLRHTDSIHVRTKYFCFFLILRVHEDERMSIVSLILLVSAHKVTKRLNEGQSVL
ncbi:ABC transporter permease subunit [Fictibacillus nanhaiensis]|uniref:ABC transporter permease subunit n=1 Tax=Fictibacillus nanhaiensis TaxID=742169 RepID=UPI002E20B3E7|nr:ABC transporter permease subunit [Fictibacillus nanhaiensis]MED1863929.1 ABC transporter permease subunit [Fictibacillus nanhaiensis]